MAEIHQIKDIGKYADGEELYDSDTSDAEIAAYIKKETGKEDGDYPEDEDNAWFEADIPEKDDDEEKETEEEEEEVPEPEDKKETRGRKKLKRGLPEVKTQEMIDATYWFADMTRRGPEKIGEDEKRYLELMIIELSKFYFPNLNVPALKPEVCKNQLKNIQVYLDTYEAGQTVQT